MLKEHLNLSFKKTHSVNWKKKKIERKKKHYSQAHETTMGTKMAVAFANIFMRKVESQILNLSVQKHLA